MFEFDVRTDRGVLRCIRTEPLASHDTEGVKGVLILVHSPPFGHSRTRTLEGLAKSLSVGTVRVDLTGCGASEGQPEANSSDRDADDIRHVVEHLRHTQSVERLKCARDQLPNELGPPCGCMHVRRMHA